MSQLAFDADGKPFEVPPTAVGWRVKRMKIGKGAPELVYGSDGTPLVVPLETDIDELRREVGTPGKYRLDAVDDHRGELDGPSAYVYVRPANAASDAGMSTAGEPRDDSPTAMTVVIEAMRQNTEMARTIVDRFPAMLEASAVLLKAADGAGLPARTPRGDEDDDDDGEDDDDGDRSPAHAPGFDMNALIAQLVPTLLMSFGSGGKLQLPNLAEMLDWRRAVPKSAQDGTAKPAQDATAKKSKPQATTDQPAGKATAATPPATDAALPPLSPQAMAHFMAIQSALSPEEAALARAAAGELSPALLRAWFDELSAMSIPEAVERVRSLLAGASKEVAA